MDLVLGETYANVFEKLLRFDGIDIHVEYNPLYLSKKTSTNVRMAVKIKNRLGKDYSLLFTGSNNELVRLSGVYEWKRKVR